MSSLYEQAMADVAGDYMARRVAVVRHELDMWAACQLFNRVRYEATRHPADRSKYVASMASYEQTLATYQALITPRGQLL